MSLEKKYDVLFASEVMTPHAPLRFSWIGRVKAWQPNVCTSPFFCSDLMVRLETAVDRESYAT